VGAAGTTPRTDDVFGHLDCGSGISGDKFLAALVDAGASVDVLRERLSALGLSGWSLSVERVTRGGLAGTLVTVAVEEDQPSRDWAAIRGVLESAPLPDVVREGALRTFALLAEAEAAVHGVEVDRVHFHEVGAVDSIVDVVGAAIGMAELGIDELWATPVRLGHGTVATSHGELPVPAPATARLLRGVPVYAGEAAGEMTTPTGAALLRAYVDRFAPLPPMTIAGEGWGAGSREVAGVANVARLLFGEQDPGGGDLEEVALLETVVDHISPEHLATALDLLLAEGALDAWATPVTMKKRRLGGEVTVLAAPAEAERLSAALMRHTGTLGVRRTLTWRSVAPRDSRTVETTSGTVRVKVAGAGSARRVRPENDDVARIALETGEPVDVTARRLTAEAESALRDDTVEGDGRGADG
jgi:uncharacterized protein (TIGR00299 family) protein